MKTNFPTKAEALKARMEILKANGWEEDMINVSHVHEYYAKALGQPAGWNLTNAWMQPLV